MVGQRILSALLLALALVALAVLLVVVVAHVVQQRATVVRDLQDPTTAFGHLTIVAALGVLAARLDAADAVWAATVLAAVAAPLWLVFAYGLPAALMLQPHGEPVASRIDGSWFLWVVGTQSLSIVASVLDLGLGSAKPTVAVSLWGIGIMLYLMLATLVMLRLLTVPNSPETMTPSYWIFTGATAVSVLAAAQILTLPGGSPALEATAPFVTGMAFVLWAFGTWWIPLLVIFGTWRYVMKRRPFRYEAGLWSVVFPLGMYAAASMRIGGVLEVELIEQIGKGATAVAAVAWVVASVSMGRAAARWVRRTAPA